MLQTKLYARSLIEASKDPLLTINVNGKIMDMNQATINITGMSREELTNSDFFEYFTNPEMAREVYKEVFAMGSVADSPLTLKHREGKLTDVLFNGSEFRDEKGKVMGVVIVARDVTDQKLIASELLKAKETAEQSNLIAQETKKLAQLATRKAEDAVNAKQQFLSNMSHEIRTPMNAIIGFTKVVLKTDLNSKQKEYLNAIKISGDALIVLINDILDLAKVDSGKMTFEQIPFRLDLSISAMLHLFETKIAEKNLKLTVDFDPLIPKVLIGDPVRLHQIILNLISNAVKFTTYGGITVLVRQIKDEGEQVLVKFAVTDTGIGIENTKLVKIFENFQQASSGTSRLYGGTGLGLAIVKQLVESQGGNIQVVSEPNNGSTFSFTLAFAKTDQLPAPENELIELFDTENSSIKVLVAEDIPLNQLLMKTILDEFGFEMEIAENGRIAVDKLKQGNFDIVLMDLQMPEMNGFEATEHIRSGLKSTIPIIALTADVTTVDLAKCKAVGMNDYIAKPVDERVLYNKILSLVKRNKKLVEMNEANLSKNRIRCVNLDYLNQRTHSNPGLMMEMISLYLEQTPSLVDIMKSSLEGKDWNTLYATVHKMIPSFSIMGIHTDFENMARKVQEYAGTQKKTDFIPGLVLQLEDICLQACDELKQEYEMIKNDNDNEQ